MTETFKSQQEIWAYLSQPHSPKVINSKVKHKIIWFKNGVLSQQWNFSNPEDWQPYIEPPKSLTFDEAVKCQKVKVDPPGDYELWGVRVLERSDGWYMSELAFLDLAERRGWPIHEVTE